MDGIYFLIAIFDSVLPIECVLEVVLKSHVVKV